MTLKPLSCSLWLCVQHYALQALWRSRSNARLYTSLEVVCKLCVCKLCEPLLLAVVLQFTLRCNADEHDCMSYPCHSARQTVQIKILSNPAHGNKPIYAIHNCSMPSSA